MRKLLSAAMALLLAVAATSALACPGDKAKDGKGEMSTPAKPKT